MIPDALWDLIEPALVWLIGLLPEVSFSCDSLQDVAGYLTWVGQFVDVSTAAAVLGAILATEALVWGVQAVVWVWNKIPLT